ncbi:MAG TPA: hypothetical protein VLL06_08775 [Nitrospiraceae bacterium]|nr:hypothetical protein [Nitrospiraceae bacterium]
MKRISKVALVTAAILSAVFLTNPAVAGRKPPPDPLTKALQEAGLKQLEDEVVRELGQALEVEAPLRLDRRTAFPPTTIDNFQPKKLAFTPEIMNQPLEPGDYSIDVIGYCTKWSLHYPGRGLPYKLARLQGRQAEAIDALLWRGTFKGLDPRHLKAMAWRIQGGVPISKWRPQEREWAHQLIPDHEASLDGDFVERTRAVYDKARTLGKLPPYETMLSRLGPVGQSVLDLQRARRVLANQTLAAERMPDLLYGRPRDGLPKTLEAGPNEPPSPWSEIRPGVFARVTIIKGDIGHNLLDLRITPQAGIPSVDKESRNRSGFAVIPAAVNIYESTEELRPSIPYKLFEWFRYLSLLIAYPEGRPAQALILVPYIGIRG